MGEATLEIGSSVSGEKELVLKALEKVGSKCALARTLGYKSPHSSVINQILKGKYHLPQWRIERLRIILKRQ